MSAASSSPQRLARRGSRWPTSAAALAIFALTFIAYAPAINAGFIWDDDVYVTENLTLRDAEGLKRIWFDLGAVPQYYPLVHSSFWIEYHLWGLNATGYHTVNILLHGLAAALLWIALRQLGFAPAVAWIAAAVFALHPVHVESVAWITERKNVLSLVFYLSALLAYLKFHPISDAEEGSPRRWRWFAAVMILFLGALLSKTITCSLPAAIVLLIWWKRGRLRMADVVPTVPMFALGFAFALLTAWMEKEVVGAAGSEWDLSIAERVLIAGRAAWFYAFSLLWPVNLSFVYPRWDVDANVWWQWLFPVFAVALLATLWMMRHRIGRGPLVAALYFGGTLVPALGFFDVYPFRFSFVADHFQYHASIGVIVLMVAAAIAMAQRAGTKPQAAVVVIWSIILITLGTLTWKQTHIYRDQESLWTDTLVKNPDSFMAHGNFAAHLAERGEMDRARIHYHKALEIKNDLPEPHLALGVDAAQRGELETAIQHFRAAIEAEPNFAAAYNGLGAALARQRRFDEAIPALRRALEVLPQFTDARLNLGLALVNTNQLEAAAEQFITALAYAPDDAKAHFLLANLLSMQGRDEQALHHFARVADVDPYRVDGHLGMGLALVRLNRPAEAAQRFREVLRLVPNHPEALRQLQMLEQTAP